MIKIDSFLTESKQGFIRRISRVASSTHYLLTLKLTYHMKKISSHKKLSSYKKKTFFPDSDCWAVSHNSQFSQNFFYVDFCQMSLDLILCSQIDWVILLSTIFLWCSVMNAFCPCISCWLWMFTCTNANVSMIQQLFQRMAELANTKHHWLGLSNFSLLAITININIIPM